MTFSDFPFPEGAAMDWPCKPSEGILWSHNQWNRLSPLPTTSALPSIPKGLCEPFRPRAPHTFQHNGCFNTIFEQWVLDYRQQEWCYIRDKGRNFRPGRCCGRTKSGAIHPKVAWSGRVSRGGVAFHSI